MNNPRHTDTKPWYRQFWPWFIIALPCAAVVGSIATAIIAINTKLTAELVSVVVHVLSPAFT